MIRFRGHVEGVNAKKPRWAYGYYAKVEDREFIVPEGIKIDDYYDDYIIHCFIEVIPGSIEQFKGYLDLEMNEIWEKIDDS